MFTRKWPLAAMIIGAPLLFVFTAPFYLWKGKTLSPPPSSVYSNTLDPGPDTAFGGLFSQPHYHDAMLYGDFRKTEDSFRRVKEERDRVNAGSVYTGTSIGPFGFQKHIKQGHLYDPDPADSLFTYYFSLKGYEVENDEVYFFVQDNSYNLAYIQPDSLHYVNSGRDSVSFSHYARKPIPFRYAAASNALLIPIPEKLYHILSIVLFALFIVYIAVYVFCFIGLPFQVLLNISKGRPFERKNILYLKAMSFVLAASVFLGVMLSYLAHLIISRHIPGEITRNSTFFGELMDKLHYFVAAGVLFIIAKAFQRGHKLQNEQDLTI